MAAGDFLSYKFPVWGWYVHFFSAPSFFFFFVLPRVLLSPLRPPGPGLYGFGFDFGFAFGIRLNVSSLRDQRDLRDVRD